MSINITISDETFDIIKDFCHDIATQDSRSTRIPYVYVIRDTKRVLGIDPDYETHGHVWCESNNENMFDGDGEFLDYLEENDYDIDIDLESEDSIYGFDKVYYLDIRKMKNIFLTERAAQNHLESYSYQYNDPDIHVIHLSGNNEIIGLITTLNEIIH